MKTGEKIRLIREIKQISAKQMADDLDMSLSGYHKIERGDVKLTTDKLEVIAGVLGVEAKDLVDTSGLIVNFNDSSVSQNTGYNIYNNFPDEMKKLYEDKVKLLEDKITYLEEVIKGLKGR